MTLVGVAISTTAIFWLSRSFSFSEVLAALHSANLWLLAPMPFFIVASFAIRAQRWRLVVEHEPPLRYWSSFSALMIGALFNNLLPARAGDVARALELSRSELISRTKVIATLIVERTVDLTILLGILSAVLVLFPALPVWLEKTGVLLALAASISTFLLVAAHLVGKPGVRWVHARIAHWVPTRMGHRLESMAFSALEGIAGTFNPARAFGFLVLSVFLWVTEVAMVWLIACAVGIDLPLGNALFVLLVIAVGTMVPSSPGFIGTYESFGVVALALVDVKGAPALACILLLHLTLLAGSTALGAVCFFLRPRPLPDP